MDVLIIKLGALGDVINTLPLAIRLKEHLSARVHWVTEPLSFPLLSRHSHVDEVILFERHQWMHSLPGLVRTLRQTRFDMAFDLQRIAKAALLCMASRSSRRIGFDRARCKEMTWIMPFERIAPADPSRHMVKQYLEFAEHLGIPEDEPVWDIPRGDPVGMALPESYVVLNVGATKPANRWKAERFAALADLIMERYHLPSVLTGASEDTSIAGQIVKQSKAEVIDLTGRTTIMELVTVIGRAKAMVSCDTGPMHLAAALGKDVVALFGPADPRRTGPYRGHVIRKPFACSPCNKKICTDPVCMDAVLPVDVMEKLELIFKKG